MEEKNKTQQQQRNQWIEREKTEMTKARREARKKTETKKKQQKKQEEEEKISIEKRLQTYAGSFTYVSLFIFISFRITTIIVGMPHSSWFDTAHIARQTSICAKRFITSSNYYYTILTPWNPIYPRSQLQQLSCIFEPRLSYGYGARMGLPGYLVSCDGVHMCWCVCVYVSMCVCVWMCWCVSVLGYGWMVSSIGPTESHTFSVRS